MTVTNLIPYVREQVERPFAERLDESRAVLKGTFEEFGEQRCGLGFSGGKDSLAALLLCSDVGYSPHIIFNNTGVEYTESVKYTREIVEFLGYKENFIETQPKRTFWDCVAEYGFPRSKTAKGNGHGGNCCKWLKEYPMRDIVKYLSLQATITGITAVENRNRMLLAKAYGISYFAKSLGVQRVHPLLWWTEQEVRSYIADHQLPLNPMYAKGCDRIGCMTCTAFRDWRTQLAKVNPKLLRLIETRMQVKR